MSAKGGITEGKSHKDGGIPMEVKSTGQKVELEGGEGVINKRNMASTKKFEFEGKEKTICEIASEINSADGNGVQIDCNNITGKKYEYAKGGKILDEDQEGSFKEWMDDGNVIEFEKGVYSTQDAQYSNKLKGMDELRRYFKKEFLSDSYAKGGWVLYDEDTEKLIKVFPTESEARKSLYEYEGNANIVEKSNWDKSNKYEGGGNIEWSKAKIGDSARVKSENKMGLIMKDYGRKFHLRFADDTEKTYDASELDFYRFDDEDDALYETGGGVDLPKANKMFHLPLELAVYVPSTQDVDKVISDSELKERVNEVSEYLARLFGGFTKSDKVGGFMASNSQLVTEDVVPVVSFATKDDFNANKNKLVNKLSEWAKRWGQEAIGFEFEGDLYYVPEKFDKGGDVRDFDWYQMWKKDQVKKGTEHELEHKDTIEKFKKEGVSDEEVAEAIAKDHLDEDENYYIELDKMESSRKLAKAINEYESNKFRRRNTKKFRIGGYVGQKGELIYIEMKEDVTTDLITINGNYFSETTYKKGTIILMHYISNNGYSTSLEMYSTGLYSIIPNVAFKVVGFNEEKFGDGGNVKPFNGLDISQNDKEILNILRELTPANSTHQQKQFVSNFRGENVINEIPNNLLSKIYGLLFEWHNLNEPIRSIYIHNTGAGNIVSLAPYKMLDSIHINFVNNRFINIEKQICSIINEQVNYKYANADSAKKVDAIINVYEKTNPKFDVLIGMLYKNEKKSIALGVAEFTSYDYLQDFKSQIIQNQGGFALNQQMIFKENKYFEVNQGITKKGKITLIYAITKY